jgi:hypothetical protein
MVFVLINFGLIFMSATGAMLRSHWAGKLWVSVA